METLGLCAGGARAAFATMEEEPQKGPRAKLSRLPRAIAVRGLRAMAAWLGSPAFARAIAGPVLFARNHRTLGPEVSIRGARSILVVRMDAIGDLVLMSSFLRELRRSNAVAWITLAVDSRFANLVELCPYVDEVVGFDPRADCTFRALALHRRAIALCRSCLWNRRFDLALIPRWDVDAYHASFLAYFSGASTRLAYSEEVSSRKQFFNRAYDTLFTHVLDGDMPKHEVEHNLDFLRSAGAEVCEDRLELWLAEEDRLAALRALRKQGVTPQDFVIAIAPGAGAAKRLWPMDRFAALGRFLIEEFDARIVIAGGPEDRDRGSHLCEELGSAAINLAGALTLRETAAVFERAHLAVTNDSGPMHLAAAAGIPVAAISCHPAGGDPGHANSPARFSPWTSRQWVLQPGVPLAPCASACESPEAHCILGVPVEAVCEAAKMLVSPVRFEEEANAEGRHAIGRPAGISSAEFARRRRGPCKTG